MIRERSHFLRTRKEVVEYVEGYLPRHPFARTPYGGKNTVDYYWYDFIHPTHQIDILRDGPDECYSYKILPEHEFRCRMKRDERIERNFLLWLFLHRCGGVEVPAELKSLV